MLYRVAFAGLFLGLLGPDLLAQDLKDTLLKEEQKILTAIKNKDKKALKDLLGTQELAVTPHEGRRGRDANVAFVDYLTIEEDSISDVKLVKVNKDVAILSYSYKWKGKFKGKPHEAKPVYATSVWALRDGKWKSVFYQETYKPK